MNIKKHIFFFLLAFLITNFVFAQSDTIVVDGNSYIKKDTKPKMDKHKFNTLFTEGNLMIM